MARTPTISRRSTVLGTSQADGTAVALTESEQRLHALILGKSGLGKTMLLMLIFLQRLFAGLATAFIDPHGDASEELLAAVVATGAYRHPGAYRSLVYLDWGSAYVPFNVLAPSRSSQDPYVISSNVLEAWVRAFPELASMPMFQTLFLASLHVLQVKHLPISLLFRLLSDAEFRANCLSDVCDPLVRQTFAQYDRMGAGGQTQAAGSLWRRAFLTSYAKPLRLTTGAAENWLDIRQLMDEGRSIIINLGGIGDLQTRRLLGSLLMVQFEQAALSRTDLAPSSRRPYCVLVDEWASFAASETTLSTILEQARKYGLTLYLAGQSLAQIPSARIAAALENTRLLISFGLGRSSAETIAAQLGTLSPSDIKQRRAEGENVLSAAEQKAQWVYDLTQMAPREAVVKVGDQPAARIHTLGMNTPRVDPEALAAVKRTYRTVYQRDEAEAEASLAEAAGSLAPAPSPASAGFFSTIFGDDNS